MFPQRIDVLQPPNILNQHCIFTQLWGDLVNLIDSKLQAIHLLRKFAALHRALFQVLGKSAPRTVYSAIAVHEFGNIRIKAIQGGKLPFRRQQAQLIILAMDGK